MRNIKICLIGLFSLWMFTASAYHHRRMHRASYDGVLRTGFYMGPSGSLNSTWILKQNNYNTLNLFYIPIVRQSEMDYVFTWGGQAGAVLGYNIIKRVGIEIEPSFSWAGQTYDDNFVGPVAALYNSSNNTFYPDPQYAVTVNGQVQYPYFVGDYKYVHVRRELKFNYIQFPIYAKYQTHIGDITNYYIMLGPQFNIRSGGSENVWVNNYLYADPTRLNVDQKFQKVDAGLSFKTGVNISATEFVYFDIGIVSFIAFNDLNGSSLKQLGWYSKNDVQYEASHSFYLGLHGGVHFFFKRKMYY